MANNNILDNRAPRRRENGWFCNHGYDSSATSTSSRRMGTTKQQNNNNHNINKNKNKNNNNNNNNNSGYSSAMTVGEEESLLKFPSKLHLLLEEARKEGFDHIISWTPCGTAFKVHSRSHFESHVMPKYFPGMSKYKSFRRQLNLYKIRGDNPETHQAPEGSSIWRRGIYAHPLLKRGKHALSTLICRPSRRSEVRGAGGNKNKVNEDDKKESCNSWEKHLNEQRVTATTVTALDLSCPYTVDDIEAEIIATFVVSPTL